MNRLNEVIYSSVNVDAGPVAQLALGRVFDYVCLCIMLRTVVNNRFTQDFCEDQELHMQSYGERNTKTSR